MTCEELVIATSPITVAGAGSVGCYVGGCLARAGRSVTLLGRPDLMHAIAVNGLRVSDRDGRDATLAPGRLATTIDPAIALSDAGLILVTVKSRDTPAIARLIARHAPSGPTVVSLQNGVGNAAALQRELGTSARVVAGMVPFNIVQTRDPGDVPHMHRATSGRIHVAAGTTGLAAKLSVPGARVIAHSNMPAVAWGKLLINLNNALNALSGLTLKEQLADRRWRLILAAQAEEALAALAAAGYKVARVDRTNPNLMPFGLRLPDTIFKMVSLALPTIDPQARSSMWEDLERRRPTEIDDLQGAIIDLAAKTRTQVPVNRRVRDLIREAELARKGSPRLSPDRVAGTLVRFA